MLQIIIDKGEAAVTSGELVPHPNSPDDMEMALFKIFLQGDFTDLSTVEHEQELRFRAKVSAKAAAPLIAKGNLFQADMQPLRMGNWGGAPKAPPRPSGAVASARIIAAAAESHGHHVAQQSVGPMGKPRVGKGTALTLVPAGPPQRRVAKAKDPSAKKVPKAKSAKAAPVTVRGRAQLIAEQTAKDSVDCGLLSMKLNPHLLS